MIVRDVRAAPPDLDAEGSLPPAWLRYTLRALGLIGWIWIIAQGIAGNSSDADVATLFLWVYGWVGLAIICALIGPAWHFLDPFSTLHDIGAWVLGRLGVQGWAIADYPERLGRWPAVIGFAFYVWLELVVFAGAATLFIVLVGYTALTLAMMAQFGRDEWRSHGETFTVWFRTLGRLAHWRLVDEEGRVHPRPFGSGLLEPGWSAADVTLVAFGVSSIIFDGLSQTETFFNLFGAPGILERTVILFAFMGIVVLLAFAVARTVGLGAIGAGLLADRRRLPDRPLPDLPADRRATDPDRHLRPAPARGRTCSAPRSTHRAATGCRRAWSGRSSWRPSSAGTCSGRGADTSSRSRTPRPG